MPAHPNSNGRVAGVGFVAVLIASATLTGGAFAAAGAGASGPAAAALLLIGVSALAVLAVVLAWPEFAVSVALFLLYTNAAVIAVNSHGGPSALEVVVPLVLVIPIAAGLLQGERLVYDRVFLLLLVLLLVEIASTLVSPNPEAAVVRVGKFALEGVVLYFLLLNTLRTPQALRRAAWTILAAGAFLSTVTVLQVATGRYDRPFLGFAALDHQFFLRHEDTPRAQGPLSDPNYYAQILLPVLVLGLVFALRQRAAGLRRLAAGISGMTLLAIAFTYSRGAALALVVVLLGLIGLRYLRSSQILAVLAAIVGLLIAVPGYRDRLASLSSLGGATAQSGSSNAADISARGRATENLAAWLVFLDHPTLGVGPGGFELFYQQYAQRVGIQVQQPTHNGAQGQRAGEAPQRAAHDLFLQVAADIGLAGLLVFLSLLAVTVAALSKVRRLVLGRSIELEAMASGLMLAILAYVTAGLFLSLAFERYFYVLLALAGAIARVLTSGPEEGWVASGAPP